LFVFLFLYIWPLYLRFLIPKTLFLQGLVPSGTIVSDEKNFIVSTDPS
jgi:hypothetical protein